MAGKNQADGKRELADDPIELEDFAVTVDGVDLADAIAVVVEDVGKRAESEAQYQGATQESCEAAALAYAKAALTAIAGACKTEALE